jgi:hypothetical protein
MSGYTAREQLVRVCEQGNRADPMRAIKEGVEWETGPNWFACADGTVISVIAGWGTWSSPRLGPGGTSDDATGPFTAVEVWFDGKDEPEGNVPVTELMEYVREHGGVVDCCPAETLRWEWTPNIPAVTP